MWNNQLAPYFLLFYWFGLSFYPFYSTDSVKLISYIHRAKEILPLFAYLTTVSLSIVVINSYWTSKSNQNQFLVLTIGICVLCYYGVNLVAFCENISNLKLTDAILGASYNLNVSVEKKLQLKFPINHFIRRLNVTIVIVLSFLIISIIFKIYGTAIMWAKPVDNCFLILMVYDAFIVLNLFMFIDMIHCVLLLINETITKFNSKLSIYMIVPHENSMLKILVQVKIIHFKLWLFKKIFIARFGWTLIAFLLQSFVYMTIISYWNIASNQTNFYGYLRKYQLFSCRNISRGFL